VALCDLKKKKGLQGKRWVPSNSPGGRGADLLMTAQGKRGQAKHELSLRAKPTQQQRGGEQEGALRESGTGSEDAKERARMGSNAQKKRKTVTKNTRGGMKGILSTWGFSQRKQQGLGRGPPPRGAMMGVDRNLTVSMHSRASKQKRRGKK